MDRFQGPHKLLEIVGSNWVYSVLCSVGRCEWNHWRRIHHGPFVHQQDEVRGQVPGEPQQAARECTDGLQQEDECQRAGAGSLPAAHLPGRSLLSSSFHTLVLLKFASSMLLLGLLARNRDSWWTWLYIRFAHGLPRHWQLQLICKPRFCYVNYMITFSPFLKGVSI